MIQPEIVTPDSFYQSIDKLSRAEFKSFDTETTGLFPYNGDSIFSCIFAIEDEAFYFNFKDYGEEQHPRDVVLPPDRIIELQPIFDHGTTFAHNAKFDWAMIEKEGVKISKPLWCTMTMARVCDNSHMKYDLKSCAERIGDFKDDAVEEYIKQHKLWKWETIPGKKNRKKNKFYDRVPFSIIVPYGLQDARVTLKLGLSQVSVISALDQGRPKHRPPLYGIVEMEREVTRVCKNMEKRGILIDVDYCFRAIDHDLQFIENSESSFKELTNQDFVDSGKELARAYTASGFEYPLTDKGNPCFNEVALKKNPNPLSAIILHHRHYSKRVNTYFRNYLYYRDKNNVVHASPNQSAASTGRLSYSDPNLQNVPKKMEGKEDKFDIRRAFIPRPDHCFIAIDYRQMELRLMLDYAKEMGLINAIKEGLDPHQVTADEVGIPRKPAKVLNFGLLYGMGVGKLAETLGVDIEEARTFKTKYFRRMGTIKRFLRAATTIAETKQYVFDWAGRRFSFPDPRFAYKAANAIIQGGCSTIAKKAMVQCDQFLENYKSRLLLQIHDELLFEVHKDELHLVAKLKELMEGIYPYKLLPMECSVSYSWKSFGDLEEIDGEIREDTWGEAITQR